MSSPFSADEGFGSTSSRERRWDEALPWFSFPTLQWTQLRFVGPVSLIFIHWVKTNKNSMAPVMCSNWDMRKRAFSKDGKCPICENFSFETATEENIKRMKATKQGLAHAIVRTIQNTSSEMPMRPIKLNASLMYNFALYKGLNKVAYEGKEYEVDITNPDYGLDVHVYYDSKNMDPSKKYQTSQGQRTPLTDIEKGYLQQMYDFPELVKYPDPENTIRFLESQGYLNKKVMGQVPPATPVNMYNVPTPPAGGAPGEMAPPPWAQQQPPMQQPPMQQPPMQQPPMQQAMPEAMPQPIPQHQPTPPPPTEDAGFGYSAPQAEPNLPIPPGAMPAAPVTAQMPQTQAAPLNVAQPPAAAASNDGPKFTVPGKGSLGKEEFQACVSEFCTKVERALPMKTWGKEGDLNGMDVPACFGDNYRGDSDCLKCFVRRQCLMEGN